MTELPLAIDLARLQFAFTVSFHIIFPAFSIGLASYLAVRTKSAGHPFAYQNGPPSPRPSLADTRVY